MFEQSKRRGKCLSEVRERTDFMCSGSSLFPLTLDDLRLEAEVKDCLVFFIILQLLSKWCVPVNLASKSEYLIQNCQGNHNRYESKSFCHNTFIDTSLERIHCATHLGFTYKTLLPDKIIVHFPNKILKRFIKNKGNKGSLIPFSSVHCQDRAQPHSTVLDEGWCVTHCWSSATDTSSLYITRKLLAQRLQGRSGSWYHLPETWKNTEKWWWNDLEGRKDPLVVRTPKAPSSPQGPLAPCWASAYAFKKASLLTSNSVNALMLLMDTKRHLTEEAKIVLYPKVH